MSMNRRKFISGLSGATMGITALFASTAHTQDGTLNDLNSMFYNEINVEEALLQSHDGIILHHGNHIDKKTLESIKYSISQMGFKVTTHFGGPDQALACYTFGNNFPASHYDDGNKHQLLAELQKLATLHQLAYEPSPDP